MSGLFFEKNININIILRLIYILPQLDRYQSYLYGYLLKEFGKITKNKKTKKKKKKKKEFGYFFLGLLLYKQFCEISLRKNGPNMH